MAMSVGILCISIWVEGRVLRRIANSFIASLILRRSVRGEGIKAIFYYSWSSASELFYRRNAHWVNEDNETGTDLFILHPHSLPCSTSSAADPVPLRWLMINIIGLTAEQHQWPLLNHHLKHSSERWSTDRLPWEPPEIELWDCQCIEDSAWIEES